MQKCQTVELKMKSKAKHSKQNFSHKKEIYITRTFLSSEVAISNFNEF